MTIAIATTLHVTTRGVSPDGTRPRKIAASTSSTKARTVATRLARERERCGTGGLNFASVVGAPQR